MAFAQLQEATIYYEVHGDGHPLVLVLVLVRGDGGHALVVAAGSPLFAQVSSHYRRSAGIQALEMRARGRSPAFLSELPGSKLHFGGSPVPWVSKVGKPVLSDSPGKPPPL